MVLYLPGKRCRSYYLNFPNALPFNKVGWLGMKRPRYQYSCNTVRSESPTLWSMYRIIFSALPLVHFSYEQDGLAHFVIRKVSRLTVGSHGFVSMTSSIKLAGLRKESTSCMVFRSWKTMEKSRIDSLRRVRSSGERVLEVPVCGECLSS